MKIGFVLCMCATLFFLRAPDFSAEGPAAEGLADKEAPSVAGPVPAFAIRTRAKHLDKRVYVEAEYPEFGIAFLDEAIRQRVEEFLEMCDFENLSVEKDGDDVLAHECSLEFALTASRPGILSVTVSEWRFRAGDAHGYRRIQARTYDLSAQKVLRLGDVFPDWEKSGKRLQALFKAYMEDFACTGVDPGRVSRDETGFDLDSEGFYGLGLVLEEPGIAQWGACEALGVAKDALQRAGADMRYWDVSKFDDATAASGEEDEGASSTRGR